MATFEVTTEDGTFEVTTEDAPAEQAGDSIVDKAFSINPFSKDSVSSMELITSGGAFRLNPFDKESPTPLQAISEGLQREEAAVAEPILDFIRDKRGPELGRKAEDKTALEAFMEGASGESQSRFTQGRQAEFGDIARELGMPEPVAKVAGLVATSFLPSSVLLGNVLRQGTKTAKKVAPKVKDIKDSVMAGFRDIFRNLEKTTPREKRVIAETLETLSGMNSDDILMGMNHPEMLTDEFARPEILGDLTDELSKRILRLQKEAPDVLSVNEAIPNSLADEIVSQFNTVKKTLGNEISAVKKTLRADKIRTIDASSVMSYVDDTLKSEGLINELGFPKKENAIAQALVEIKNTIVGIAKTKTKAALKSSKSKTADVFDPATLKTNKVSSKEFPFGAGKNFTFENAVDVLDSIDDVVFKIKATQGAGDDVIRQVKSQLQVVLQPVRSFLRQKIGREFPEVQGVFSRYSKFKDVQNAVGRKAGNSKQIAGLLRRYEKAAPEQLEELNILLDFIPNGQQIKSAVRGYLGAKADSVENILGITNKLGSEEISKTLAETVAKDLKELSKDPAIMRAFQKLINADPKIANIFTKKVMHEISSEFSKNGFLLRTLAAMGTGMSFGASIGGVTGGGLGGLAFAIASQPKVLREFIKHGSKAKGLAKFSQEVSEATPKALKRGVKRRLAQEVSGGVGELQE